jgi:hypothetical protein
MTCECKFEAPDHPFVDQPQYTVKFVMCSNCVRYYKTSWGLVSSQDIQAMVDAAAAEQEQLIAEALSMKEDGYEPVPFDGVVERQIDPKLLEVPCRCSIVQLMQAGCLCGGK